MYYRAAEKMQLLAINLYEELHTEKGNPKSSLEDVTLITNRYQKELRYEFDLIRSSTLEFEETSE